MEQSIKVTCKPDGTKVVKPSGFGTHCGAVITPYTGGKQLDQEVTDEMYMPAQVATTTHTQ